MNPFFPSLNDSARLWIWVADARLSERQQAAVMDAIGGFVSGWTSHGRRVQGAASIFLDQVLVLAADIAEAEISGCGIDKSVHALERVATEQSFDWSSALDVALVDRATNRISLVPRGGIRKLVEDGQLSPDDTIVDRNMTKLGELRSGGLNRDAKDTWAARYFRQDSTSRS